MKINPKKEYRKYVAVSLLIVQVSWRLLVSYYQTEGRQCLCDIPAKLKGISKRLKLQNLMVRKWIGFDISI